MPNEFLKRAEEFRFDNELIERITARPFLRRTWRETLYLITTLPAALLAITVVSVGLSLALALALIVVGLPLVMAIFWVFRKNAALERRRLRIVDQRPLHAQYAPDELGKPLRRSLTMLVDGQSWKDIGWLTFLSTVGAAVASLALGVWVIALGWMVYPLFGWALPGDFTPLGPIFGNDMYFAESFLMIPLGIAMIPVATWIGAGASLLLSSVARLCLESRQATQLHARVDELERTREQTIQQQTTEMSRIERDLHDGAQARLVALSIDLGLAEQKIEQDPAAAKELVAEARDEAQRTLAELRDLVRGLGPQILRDRGLEAALVPLAARSTIPVELDVGLDGRPPEQLESVAYFIASEALANAAKHSSATKVHVNVWSDGDELRLRVSDDGSGGADAGGAGLEGLAVRAQSVDGRLEVSSPAGGPTIIEAWLPCPPSS